MNRTIQNINRAMDPKYWQTLNPSLSVCSTGVRKSKKAKRKVDIKSANNRIKTEGWFSIDEVFPPEKMQKLAACILKLAKSGWPPVYAFVYDEFWDLLQTPELVHVLRGLLGSDYQQKLSIWAHLVHPRKEAHGWPPHIDSARKDGSACFNDGSTRLLSLSIALSDMTLDNGCIYLVPADRLSPAKLRRYLNQSHLKALDLHQLLHSARAVPLKKGAIAGWRQDILHWGSLSSERAKSPRLSLTFEFQVKNGPKQSGLIDGGTVPNTLDERLLIISDQVLKYLGRWEKHRTRNEHVMTAKALRVLLSSGRSIFRQDRKH